MANAPCDVVGLRERDGLSEVAGIELEKDFAKLEAQSIAFEIALQHKTQENNSLKILQKENVNFLASLQIENAPLKQTYKDLFKSVQSSRVGTIQCDEVQVKFDFDKIKTQNIELEHQATSLLKEIEHLKLTYQNMFDSIKKLRVQTKSSNVTQNEAKKLKSQLFEFADTKFDNILGKIELFKKNQFDSFSSSNVDCNISELETESGEKNNIFESKTCVLRIKIVELEKTLAKQTKENSVLLMKIDNLENAFADEVKRVTTGKLTAFDEENFVVQKDLSKPVTAHSLPKNEKDQLLKQIASLESKLASQDILSRQKKYSELRTSYNALKAEFDSLNQTKRKTKVFNSSKPKVSVSDKVHTDQRYTSANSDNQRTSSNHQAVDQDKISTRGRLFSIREKYEYAGRKLQKTNQDGFTVSNDDMKRSQRQKRRKIKRSRSREHDWNETTITQQDSSQRALKINDQGHKRDLNDHPLGDDYAYVRLWIKLFDKINVFAWKVYLDRLPSRENLIRRGIQVPSLSCPICNSAHEDLSHLLFSCSMATDVVRLVCRWWDLGWMPLGSYSDWLSWFKSIRLGSKPKGLLEGVFYVTWWSLWNFRNQLLFAGKNPRKDVIFDDIVERSFIWCSARCQARDNGNLTCNNLSQYIPYSLSFIKISSTYEFEPQPFVTAVRNLFTGLSALKDMDLSYNQFIGDVRYQVRLERSKACRDCRRNTRTKKQQTYKIPNKQMGKSSHEILMLARLLTIEYIDLTEQVCDAAVAFGPFAYYFERKIRS
ncbi:RNA-directed DNA polymerase, eukaryota [Tanacetum coccineum]